MLADPRSLTGMLVGETAERVELVVADGSTVRIPVAMIEARTVRHAFPMPAGPVRTPEEPRDLLVDVLSAE